MGAALLLTPGNFEDDLPTAVDPADYYLRGAPMFETAEKGNPYNWLNNVVAVSVGKQEALGVTYDVYQIL